MFVVDNLINRLVAMVGLVLIALGIYNLPDTIFLVKGAEVAEGVVLGARLQQTGDGSYYLPTVAFVTRDGQSIEFTSNTGEGGKWKDRVGESVTVRHDPDKPANASIDSFFQIWGLPIILLLAGGTFTFVGRQGPKSLP